MAIGRRAGALETTEGDILWRVWAPLAERVELGLLQGEQGNRWQWHPMTQEEHGYFFFRGTDIPTGQRYYYRLNGGDGRADPCALWQPDGVFGPSAVFRPSEMRWNDERWTGVARKDLVFYELHVGTFTPEGTFDAIVPRLHQLRDLGVTALEIMPIGQFPGERNWGYDGVFPFAAQNSYGGPRAFARLVDACHSAGLAVFLDVVYNHLGPVGNYCAEFGPYFSDRYRVLWGATLNFDGSGCDAVRDYVLDNARMWFEEFHLDGLRLDAVHAIVDTSARHIMQALKKMTEACQERTGRTLHIVAESDQNDPRYLAPREQGGYALDMQWSDDFHHAVHAYLTGERHGYYEDYGDAEHVAQVLMQPFLYTGEYSRHRGRKHGAPPTGLAGERFVVAVQNHDQVGNRACGERISEMVCPARQRLIASLVCLSPYIPLLFMGQEYGEERPFLFFTSFDDEALNDAVRTGRCAEFAHFCPADKMIDPCSPEAFERSKLTWSWPEGSTQTGLRRLHRDLLAARRIWPALRDFEDRNAFFLPEMGESLRFLRGGREYDFGKTIEAIFNLTGERRQLFLFPPAPQVRLFSSESSAYAGARTQDDPENELLPYECVVYGPPTWPGFAGFTSPRGS
jgi:maltooligosyltrehalose trehalohydrolase